MGFRGRRAVRRVSETIDKRRSKVRFRIGMILLSN